MNRQFSFFMKHKSAMKNNFIKILDQTYQWSCVPLYG
jgi:hypothetical protein